ncbi:MAG: DUF1722 domain-containing protein [Planctomycetota bacterium]|nr:MAG: DUF1722 domain-containing protein [Planctomycetota bacterium]
MKTSHASKPGGWIHWHNPEFPLRLGVSACLLGEKVRFDTGHARDRFVTDTLGQWFEFVPVCPEVEIGMGIPRPTIRLVKAEHGLRLVAPSTGEDFGETMTTFSEQRVNGLMAEDLDGFILKKGSPSCGMERVKVYHPNGMPTSAKAAGLFASALQRKWPTLPIEEDGRLHDKVLRENFIERVFCRNRWRLFAAQGSGRGGLVEFHTAHKLLIRAHNEAAYRRLGRIVASAGQLPDAELFSSYEREFQSAMKSKGTVKRHVNVLHHAMGYLKKKLDSVEKQELLTCIEDYRQGLLPLIVPLSLLRYNIRRHQISYLAGQLYFDPHPKELMLRNHA